MDDVNFIKKMWGGKIDDLVHLQFQKFSKGEFKNKALIEATASKDAFKISTTAEFANEFVGAVAKKLGNNKAKVKGVIVSTRNLDNELDFKDKKQFMGIKQYVIDGEMDGKEIVSLCEKFPASFLALSFETSDTQLKIKPKAPKSAKPSAKGESKPKVNFCKLTTTDKELVKDILFDVDINNLKKVEIGHTFLIKEIILPKDEKDFEKIRILSKRKGKIVRKITIDDKEIVNEKDFIA